MPALRFQEHDPEDARLHLADAAREVIRELASSTASSEEFERARELVEQAAAVLAARTHGRDYEGAEASLAELGELGETDTFLDASPFVGSLNPLAAPIRLRYDEDHPDGARVIGTAVFGAAYEGPPGCVHGGIIAGGFDEVLGCTQSMAGHPGLTARLEVSYRAPTPLHQEVRFEGRIDRIEGRKIFTSATLHHGDLLCAEATGLFVSMKPDVLERLMRSRAQRAG